MICPQCGWTGDIGSEAHRTFIHAAPVTDAGLREAAEAACRGWFDEIKDDRDMRGLMLALRAALSRQAEKETA